MTQEEAREAILAQWLRIPAWKRSNPQDASDFIHAMLTSRPDLTDFESAVDRFFTIRGWLSAEQRRTAQPSSVNKRAVKAKRGKETPPPEVAVVAAG